MELVEKLIEYLGIEVETPRAFSRSAGIEEEI